MTISCETGKKSQNQEGELQWLRSSLLHASTDTHGTTAVAYKLVPGAPPSRTFQSHSLSSNPNLNLGTGPRSGHLSNRPEHLLPDARCPKIGQGRPRQQPCAMRFCLPSPQQVNESRFIKYLHGTKRMCVWHFISYMSMIRLCFLRSSKRRLLLRIWPIYKDFTQNRIFQQELYLWNRQGKEKATSSISH